MSDGTIRPMMKLVNETLLALADLKALEARTAQADWHRSWGWCAGRFGAAVRFRVSDGEGRILPRSCSARAAKRERATQEVKNYGPELRQFYVRREDSAKLAGARPLAAQS